MVSKFLGSGSSQARNCAALEENPRDPQILRSDFQEEREKHVTLISLKMYLSTSIGQCANISSCGLISSVAQFLHELRDQDL